ncbi:MAG: hypothetical protein DELT_02941 [Desulfovibrio sp.]
MNPAFCLTVELVAAARECAPSLQKSLALSRMFSLCAELGTALAEFTWTPGRYTRFAVQEPKLREIFAPSFPDRIVQGWLAGRMRPLMERAAIDDSYANRVGKGTHTAIAKVQKLMRKPDNDWCLQLDVRNYFHSIRRPVLLAQMLSLLDKYPDGTHEGVLRYAITALLRHDAREGYRMAERSGSVLRGIPGHKSLLSAKADTGLPIGGAASQSFANFYLNPLDHFIKHELRVKAYTRYMDDLLLLAATPQQLFSWRDAVRDFLRRELHLELHDGKEQLTPARQGVRYLGYKVYPQYLHAREPTVSTLKARLDFFKHLFWPREYPRCQRPVRGFWQSWLEDGPPLLPLEPEWTLLKHMEATINSYLGIMGHAHNARLRMALYHGHFGPLRQFFIPTDANYAAVNVCKKWLRPERRRGTRPAVP